MSPRTVSPKLEAPSAAGAQPKEQRAPADAVLAGYRNKVRQTKAEKSEAKAMRVLDKKLAKGLDKLSEDDRSSLAAVVNDVTGRGVSLADFARGGHVVMGGDQGKFYESFKDLKGVRKRTFSSHYKGVEKPQYELSMGNGLGSILCGVNHKGESWAQWEAHPAELDDKGLLLHLATWARHAAGGGQKNIGVAGTSDRTEKSGREIKV